MLSNKESLTYSPDIVLEQVISGEKINSPKIAQSVYRMARRISINNEKNPDDLLSVKRVAMVTPYHPLYEIGGLEISTRKLAQQLTELGHGVEIITKGLYPDSDQRGKQVSPEGISVHGIGAGIEEIVPYVLSRRKDFDIVQWMEIFPPVPESPEIYNDKAEQQYMASILLRSLGIKTFLNIASCGSVTNRGINRQLPLTTKKHQPLNVLLNRSMTAYLGINPDIASEFEQVGIVGSTDRFESIPSGVDDKLFLPCTNDEQRNIREDLGLPLDKKIVLFIGRFVQRKRPDLLVDIWNNLPLDVQKNGCLVFVGGKAGDGQPDSIYNQVSSTIQKHNKQRAANGQNPNIYSFDLVDHYQMPRYIQACDALFFPSEREGLGMVIPEVMACAKPVFASNIPGIREVVPNSNVGILFDPYDLDEMQNILVDFINNPDKFTKMGERSRDYVSKCWNWQSIALKLSDTYRRYK